MRDTMPLTVTFDGQTTPLGLLQDIDNDKAHPLVRAVLISLFTWRRANADDTLPDPKGFRMGWWGDSYPAVANDRIGSRLWLLARAKLTLTTVQRAQDYAEEALQWLIDDGVAARIAVRAERQGLSTLALQCTLFAADGTANAVLRFDNLWSLLNV
ncbi:phage GP46 family protein [uncultured Ralstonia sp.]|jgi:phage gp46-like protein|uniref:phage GP46 family protein n=1 Tax=Ralstonia sp. TaxID=54061 RepID=UPI0025E78FAA|nr:phage GP46 family protein [uncultured Ralstonia sp.]